jgi:hypothetical protein
LIFLSILICIGAFYALLWMLRRDHISLGVPVAYLFALLLIHVPGAIAHAVGGNLLQDSDLTNLGIGFTAVGAVSFVCGVWLARLAPMSQPRPQPAANRRRFATFCLSAGWFFTYGLSYLRSIPSFGALVDKAGAVWMLGVMIGLRDAIRRSDRKGVALWAAALAVYPILMLVFGGFMSYGSTAVIVVVSALAISTRSHWHVLLGSVVAGFLAFHIFLSYFEHRDQIRAAVWEGTSLDERIEASMSMVTDFKLFDATNTIQLTALNERLNQNYFVGLAATRINESQVEYLYGRSLWDGLIALVPRAIWPEKPVVAGSPKIVSEMTGLTLSDTTSFGVGNVMEFQINFGIPGVVGGFLLLGWAIGTLDKRAAETELHGDLGRTIFYFLPAVALIQPNGSVVELASGCAAAFLSAYAWMWAWTQWLQGGPPHRLPAKPSRRRA